MDLATSVDYGSSYLYFRDTPNGAGENHTPRALIDASCSLQPAGAATPTRFYAGCPCATERMYTETGLIHDPMAEFRFIFATNEQFLMLKWGADAENDVRAARWKTETMPGKLGDASLEAFWPKLRYHPHMRRIDCYAQIRAAHMCEAPYTGAMNARTSYTTADGTRVVLDYPIRTSNVGNADESWQMDVGPLLMPLPQPDPDHRPELLVSQLSLGYLVYNKLDYAEGIVRAKTQLTGGGHVNFFSQRTELDCMTEIFAALDSADVAKL